MPVKATALAVTNIIITGYDQLYATNIAIIFCCRKLEPQHPDTSHSSDETLFHTICQIENLSSNVLFSLEHPVTMLNAQDNFHEPLKIAIKDSKGLIRKSILRERGGL